MRLTFRRVTNEFDPLDQAPSPLCPPFCLILEFIFFILEQWDWLFWADSSGKRSVFGLLSTLERFGWEIVRFVSTRYSSLHQLHGLCWKYSFFWRRSGSSLGDGKGEKGIKWEVSKLNVSWSSTLNDADLDHSFFFSTSKQLYLEAWTFVAAPRKDSKPSADATPSVSHALDLLEFNWSSVEFSKFVRDIEELLNDLPQPSQERFDKLADVWKRTLWFEERFWEAGQKWGELEGDA